MAYQCEVKEQASRPTLSVRTRTSVGKLPEIMGQTYGMIAQYLGSLGEQPAGPPFAAYHNMDMEDLDVEIGFPVSREIAGRGDIQAGQLPGGRVATCLHVGPYGDIAAAYNALSEWVEAEGHEPAGVAYEMYLNDPNETPPEALMTQIVYPLETD